MPQTLAEQARRLHQVFSALVRAYQFRDRDDICCHGISVSQCYAMDALATLGPRTMGELAGDLYLEISSMTRAVDALVAGGLVARVEDARDRRVRRVQITPRGRKLLNTIQGELVAEYERVLGGIAPESRPAVIEAVTSLLQAFQGRQRGRSGKENSACCSLGSDAGKCSASVSEANAVGARAARRKTAIRKARAGSKS